MKRYSKLIAAITFVVGCGTDRDHGTPVTAANDLGIASVETERLASGGNTVLVLHALASDGSEAATIRVERGDAVDLGELGAATRGTKLEVTVNATTATALSAHPGAMMVTPIDFNNDAAAKLLEIAEVASALEREANVLVAAAEPAVEGAYTTGQCSGAEFPSGNLLRETCCWSINAQNGLYPGGTMIRRLDANGVQSQTVGKRIRNPYGGVGCRTTNNGTCSGSQCYYGPGGYGPATFYPPSPSNYYAHIFPSHTGAYSQYASCVYSWNATNVAPIYSDVSNSTGARGGCPILPGTESFVFDDGAAIWDLL